MPHRVRITDEAENQIEAIGDYIALDSPSAARKWIRRLRSEIQTLESFPERHEIAFSAEEAGTTIRRMLFGVYVVYYTNDHQEVVIQSVRHGYREPPQPRDVLTEE